MSLAARLSSFFLVALVVVLLGFSVALFSLARLYLVRQADQRLAAALDTLAAAAEIEPDGIEWEPREHHLTLGLDPGADQVRWTVQDAAGKLVDRSANLASGVPGPDWPAPLTETQLAAPALRESGQWHFLQRCLRPGGDGETKPGDGEGQPKYAALVLTSRVSLAPAWTTLRTLAAALAGLSLGLWLLAALLGRRLCRRALAPVRQMATAARAMGALDLDRRLPGPGTGDELEDLGGAFNGLLARLQEAFERQRRFTGDASHQLRTPLTAMLGQIDVALRRPRPAEDYREALGQVRGQAVQLRQIVEALLFLARADVEAGPADLAAMDLALWLPEHLGRWTGHARGADLHLERSDSGAVWVRAQVPLLGQLLDNLLENACKYSEPGRSVTVGLGCAGGDALLTVEDQGSGIAPEDLPHVFEPFYRSPEARRLGRPGVGLGLAVARRVAAVFGGTLTAASEPGGGSRFTLRLPRCEANGRAPPP
jgi:signal transduction histidine kinase